LKVKRLALGAVATTGDNETEMDSSGSQNSWIHLARTLSERFSAEGFELFLVGGALRDRLLGLRVSELDFATNARPNETLRLMQQIDGASVYRIGERYGTIGVIAGASRAEITTYRSGETYPKGSRKPAVEFGHSLEEDLSRRDFTVNAMAIESSKLKVQGSKECDAASSTFDLRPSAFNLQPSTCPPELIDPFNGLADLNAHIIRSVGDPEERFREDPLRLLRGIRFAAALGYELEPTTWTAMRRLAGLLGGISRERIAEELSRMLVGRDPRRAFTLLRDSGLLGSAVPEVLALDAMPDHGPRHPLSLWDHTMNVVAATSADLVTRWAALLHDIAKPQTRSIDGDGRIHFLAHDELGARTASRILESLRMSSETTAAVRDLVETHMQVHQYSPEWSDGAVRRLRRHLGPNFERALDLARADSAGHGHTSWGITMVEALAAQARALEEALPVVNSPLNGREIMEHYGGEPGPWIGLIKDALTEKVLEGELDVADKQAAWRLADQVVAEARP